MYFQQRYGLGEVGIGLALLNYSVPGFLLGLVLNIAFTFSYVELILSIKNEHEYAGGPFPKLAREAAQLSEPEFKYSPASPKIPFSNPTEFLSAVNFGISVFQEVKQAILPDEIKQSYLSFTK